MVLPPMSTPELRSRLGASAEQADELVTKLQADRTSLPVLFPGLPRRFGKQAIGGGRVKLGDATVDLDGFRTCDLVAALLVTSILPTEAELNDLFAHGDIEERSMLLRSLNFLPLDRSVRGLFDEVLRTNVVLHLEAAMCDSDLLWRAIQTGAVDAATGNRLLLKFAFLDMSLARALGAEQHASSELSTMLQDLATEREAAGRSVWRDTWRMLGNAPCPGAPARLLGGLEHGDDGVREAAADGLLALPSEQAKELQAVITRFANERIAREPRPAIQERLQRLASR